MYNSVATKQVKMIITLTVTVCGWHTLIVCIFVEKMHLHVITSSGRFITQTITWVGKYYDHADDNIMWQILRPRRRWHHVADFTTRRRWHHLADFTTHTIYYILYIIIFILFCFDWINFCFLLSFTILFYLTIALY